MPIPFLENVLFTQRLPEWLPEPRILATAGAAMGSLYFLKSYMSGAMNPIERVMHGRVIMVTGGTSGIGAAVVRELAQRGAQIVLLTRVSPSDAFLADYIGDLRASTGNEMIYAEQVDLSSLHGIRAFATKWIDNAPPRRLDTLILCGSALSPPGGIRCETAEGVEQTWMVNYLANFHLLGILSPALRAQPFDRDVRIIIPTCSAYISSVPFTEELDKKKWSPGKAYARSKLALMVFAQAFQKHLDAYKRPDELPMNARVVCVDPGLARTAGTRSWITRGTIWGLLTYLLLYVLPWLFLKSAEMAAQSILFAVMDPNLGRGPGGKLIKECREVDYARVEVKDEAVAKKLWEASDKLIEKTEKKQAELRALEKKRQEELEKRTEELEKTKEIESLVGAIKKGKETEKMKEKNSKSRKQARKAI